MSDYPVLDVRAESARLGGLSSYGRTPDPALETVARRRLHTARLDREIRSLAAADLGGLDDARAGHIIGLLLSVCGVKADAITVIESAVRAAVVAAAHVEQSAGEGDAE